MRHRAAVTTVLLLAVFTGLLLAVARPSEASAKGKPCWERVIDDWVDNGTIDKHYKTACLQAALKNVPEDLRDYSNLPAAINAALQASLRPGGGGPGSGGGQSGSGGTGSGGSDSGPAGKNRELQGGPSPSYYRRAIDNLGTTSADSVPIPLLVLAGLGGALLLTAGGLLAAKRIRAHRAGTPPLD